MDNSSPWNYKVLSDILVKIIFLTTTLHYIHYVMIFFVHFGIFLENDKVLTTETKRVQNLWSSV